MFPMLLLKTLAGKGAFHLKDGKDPVPDVFPTTARKACPLVRIGQKSRFLVGEDRFSAAACKQEVWQTLQFFRIVLIGPNKHTLRPSP